MKQKTTIFIAAAALLLAVLTSCGSDGPAAPTSPADQTPAEASIPEEKNTPEILPEKTAEPEETVTQPTDPPEETPEDVPEETPEETPEEPPANPAPEPDPEPEPEPEPAPEPEPEPAPAGLADGTYTISVLLEGGTGRASVETPCKLRVENGEYWATLIWSSSNYDYMKVDGQRYDQTNTEGNSTFEIPVPAFDQKLDVIADTIAMSEPHEIDYTLTFDSATIQ